MWALAVPKRAAALLELLEPGGQVRGALHAVFCRWTPSRVCHLEEIQQQCACSPRKSSFVMKYC